LVDPKDEIKSARQARGRRDKPLPALDLAICPLPYRHMQIISPQIKLYFSYRADIAPI